MGHFTPHPVRHNYWRTGGIPPHGRKPVGLHGEGLDEVLLRATADNKIVYYHNDGLGSVVNLTGGGGKVIESYRYDAYGKPEQTSSRRNTRMFTGREYDAMTGLYDLRVRVYSPAIGRFLQKDPLGKDSGDLLVGMRAIIRASN